MRNKKDKTIPRKVMSDAQRIELIDKYLENLDLETWEARYQIMRKQAIASLDILSMPDVFALIDDLNETLPLCLA